jgi:hypothetical protein
VIGRNHAAGRVVGPLESVRDAKVGLTMPLSASTRPSGASEPPEPGTGPTDGQDGSQRDVEPPPVLRARAREAEPYVLAETVTASDGTLIHIWAPRSCCERPRQPVPVAHEGERGRR